MTKTACQPQPGKNKYQTESQLLSRHTMPYLPITSELRLPHTIQNPGLLVGWSMEFRAKKAPIGFHHGDPLKVPDTGYIDPIVFHGEGHLMTIAPTGAGKGTGCIVPALLRYQGPVIVVDPKGENAAITARHRRAMGQQVIVLDPMGITDFPSDTFNPLDVADITQASAVDEVAALATNLCKQADTDSRSLFWRQRATHVLIGVMLQALQRAHEARQAGQDSRATLTEVRDLINRAASDPQELSKFMEHSSHPEVQRIAASLRISASETLGGIIAFAQEAIDFLRGDQIHTNIATSSFDTQDITLGKPLSIYLVLPPHMLESHGRLLRLWLTAFISCITRRRGKPEHNTLFILDEAAQLGELPQLRQAITLLRGYGLQTWSFWQDVSQLQLLYPSDWQTMVNNCRVLQCFGALNQAAAGDMASLTGFGDAYSVLELLPNEMLLQAGGDQTVVAQLPNYLNDPLFTGQYDPNPFHTAGRDILRSHNVPQRLYQRPQRPDTNPARSSSSITWFEAPDALAMELLVR